MNQLLEKILEQEQDEFEELFQPISDEEFEARLAGFVKNALEKGKCIQNEDGTWSCKDDVDLHDLGLKKLPVKFKKVEGYFDCSLNQLTSLEGAPEYVGRSFNCGLNQLTSLQGAPKYVGAFFICSDNQLKTLEGAPEHVGGDFSCDNNKLTSLKGAPEEVGEFYCSHNKLTTLEGAPEYVGGDFWCDTNKLTSLEGAPEYVGGEFDCSYNPVSEEELKKTVNRDYLK